MEMKSQASGGQSPMVERPVLRYDAHGAVTRRADMLVREEPLEIRIRGRSIAVTMRTPGHDGELAIGFLVSEGLIRDRAEIFEIAYCRQNTVEENVLNVFLAPGVEVDLETLTRHVFASSSCGLCGKATIESVHQRFAPVATEVKIGRAQLQRMLVEMRQFQAVFERTGGLHAAAVFGVGGELVAVREDVGRHNAVDKVIGFALAKGPWPLGNHVLIVSGRASFEILQKALSARIPIVVAVSAPSSLAVEFAVQSGQTLIGFAREGQMNVYAGAERIVDSESGAN